MKAIFLDRDGTLNVDTGYVHKIPDFAFEKNVLAGLKILQAAGFSFFIITNQAGIGKGYFSEKDFEVFNQHLLEQLALHEIHIEKTYFCPFHPAASVEKYKQDSNFRKPATGMLEQAAKEFPIEIKNSWIIGDKWSDVQTGNNFGIKSILLKSGKSGSDNQHQAQATYVAQDFLQAANFIIKFQNNV
jgi:D-glycero-D-manno-heptose 1,7-bisphosphate phosphatase